MTVIYREYHPSDYQACEALVNQAWNFDTVFTPSQLAKLAKLLYTKGALLSSNCAWVAEYQGEVAGFIFGLNEARKKKYSKVFFGLNVIWKLLRLPNTTKPTKKQLVEAISVHEKNRATLVPKHRSEIVLFVVNETTRGRGVGKKLWSQFLHDCISHGSERIFVETNKRGASAFYQRLGFTQLGDFDSPLHEFATPDGQACVMTYGV